MIGKFFEIKKKKIYSNIFVSILFLILLLNFYNLQISSMEKYVKQSRRNRIREEIIKPARGLIFDKNGILLVDNRPTYSVGVIPYEIRDKEYLIKFLDNNININRKMLEDKLKNLRRSYQPIKLLQVGFKEISILEERRSEISGIIFQREPRRFYPRDDIYASHILGYLGEVTENEIQKFGESVYQPGDYIGKEGLEKKYEDLLKGSKGYRYVEVDVFGRVVGETKDAKSISPELGDNLYLTIDKEIQRLVEEELEGTNGAAVVLDTRTSGILALASSPDYDPNLIAVRSSDDIWKDLLNATDSPLFNRAIKSQYPPASVLKLVLAAAAFNEDIIDLEWSINCPGYFNFGINTFKCWKEYGHGKTNLLKAIQRSCDVFFYNLMLEVGHDIWSDYMYRFGFGRKTSIDLPEEEEGLVPTKEYFDRKYGINGWAKGELINLAIGQGPVLVTPIQLAMFGVKIANNGLYYKPHILDYYEDVETGEKHYTKYERFQVPGISEETYQVLKKGMEMVVNTQDGTAKSARVPGIKVAGKTGTAQNPQGEDHSMFLAFAPLNNPEIALFVIVENAGMGSAVAAPIAGRILRFYFRNKSKIAMK